MSLDSNLLGDKEYTVQINKGRIPFRVVRNIFYWMLPFDTEEKATKKKENLLKKYGLKNEDIEIYSRYSAQIRSRA